MTTVTIKINGVEYNLKGEEDEEYLKHVANYVEGKIQDILEKNPRLPGPAASALTAVNIANDLFKGNKEFNELLDSFKVIESENKKLKEEYVIANENSKKYAEENEELTKELASLKDNSMEKMQTEIEKLKEQLSLMEEKAKDLVKQNNLLRTDNRELKFNLQSSKYKLLDLEKKFLDSQITIATEKKNKNVLVSNNK